MQRVKVRVFAPPTTASFLTQTTFCAENRDKMAQNYKRRMVNFIKDVSKSAPSFQ